ncbi:hypothetical protein N7493_000351 [Penicillium malachiteum]|uniref:Uncharacterized protein n=1 Tax=Penicillium malachiteum TaxID=1324776 RepID=A0AAD6HW46_9EURO|nr:hypothetical protein N7493_000351 [Penicillium malachiteum]
MAPAGRRNRGVVDFLGGRRGSSSGDRLDSTIWASGDTSTQESTTQTSEGVSRRHRDNNSETQARNKNWKDAYKKITNLRRWGSKKNQPKRGHEESLPDEDFPMSHGNPNHTSSFKPEKSYSIGITCWPSNIANDPNRQGRNPWSRTEYEMFDQSSRKSSDNFFSRRVKRCIPSEHENHRTAMPTNHQSSAQTSSRRAVRFPLDGSSSAPSASRTPGHPVPKNPRPFSALD